MIRIILPVFICSFHNLFTIIFGSPCCNSLEAEVVSSGCIVPSDAAASRASGSLASAGFKATCVRKGGCRN